MSDAASGATLNLLYHVSRELVSDLDLHTVLERILSLSSRYVGAERASVVLLDDDFQPLEGAIIVDDRLLSNTGEQLRGTVDHGLAGWVLRHGQSALVTDSRWDERWQKRPDDAVERSGAKSALCVPVISHEKIIGLLTLVHPKTNFFNSEHLSLLESIADQASIAFHNARLHSTLQAAHKRFQELFEDSLDPILVTAWNGLIIEANRQAVELAAWDQDLRGSRVEQLLGMGLDWLSDHEDELAGGQKLRIECTLTALTGESVPVEAYIRKISVNDQTAVQWILRDITERKELDLLRDSLTESIVHDLRAPLSNIISSLEFMNFFLSQEGSEDVHEIVSIASRSAARMLRLVNSLLDIDRMESGQLTPARTHEALAPLLKDALEAVQSGADAKAQHLHVDFADHLPEVWIDRDMILRVVINLLDNAVKYTPNEGNIALSARSLDGALEIVVRDSGPGIPPHETDAVFNKFYRLRAAQKKSGFGLGLAFCKLAIEAHGGRIWVESEPEAGSRFIMRLPAGQPPDPTMQGTSQ